MKDQAWAFDYCRDLVRQHDRDRYLACLFAPEEKRPLLWALYAFNFEVARIRELVSEPELGEMRLAWWNETVEAIYSNKIPAHPVATSLALAIERHELPKAGLLHLIEARRFDLYDDAMPSLADLEGYLGETSATIIQLASFILAGASGKAAAEAAGLAGVASGIAGLLRSIPLHSARGQCYVPEDILQRCGLTRSDFTKKGREEASLAAIKDLVAVGRKRFVEARRVQGVIPANAFPAFLSAGLAGLYLDRLDRQGTKVLFTTEQVSQISRQWRLWRIARAGSF